MTMFIAGFTSGMWVTIATYIGGRASGRRQWRRQHPDIGVHHHYLIYPKQKREQKQ